MARNVTNLLKIEDSKTSEQRFCRRKFAHRNSVDKIDSMEINVLSFSASYMANMSVSFTNRVRKSNILIGSDTSNSCFFILKLRFLMWTRTSAVALNVLVSVVVIRRYERYDISLSKIRFAGLIDLSPTWGGSFGREWNGTMLLRVSGSS